MKIIARIYTDFPEKFGIPRQSGLAPELKGRIVFEPKYRNPDAVRGLEEFQYIWLLWEFQGVERENWSATVRPPRLGGNKRLGVFATRSPFRPNPIGLSCVKLEGIEVTGQGCVLLVSGVDLRDATPIYDIKPYLAYADSHPEAGNGFAEMEGKPRLRVHIPTELAERMPPDKRRSLAAALEQDPRPAYQRDADRVYGMRFAGYHVKFKADDAKLFIEVVGIALDK